MIAVSGIYRLLMAMIVLIQITLLVSCSKSQEVNSSVPGSYLSPTAKLPVRIIKDLPYGPDASQKMDLILPKGRTTAATKMIVLIHGGQWTAGDKSNMEEYVTVLGDALPQFAFASINYRLVNGNSILLADAEKDISRALTYLRSMRDSFVVSKDMVMLGESAGGHLALLNAYKNRSIGIRAVIGVKAPTDLSTWYNEGKNKEVRSMLEFITGGTPTTATSAYFSLSPVNYVSKDAPYTLLIHGDADGFVEVSQANELSNKLSIAGAKHKLIILPGESHSYSPTSQDAIYKNIIELLSDHNLFK